MQEEAADTKIAVLLVDDQRFIGTALGLLLAHERDIALHFCQDATQAVGRANEVRPAVILQDLVLPDTDGLAMIERFRSNPATAHTPIVILSATDDLETRGRATAAGACDYLVKLPSRDALVACIRQQAGHSTAPSSPVAAAAEEQPAISLGVLDELRDGDDGGLPEFAVMLIDEFVSEATAQVAELEQARRGGNTALLKAKLHGLKGSALTMGARRFAGLCAGMEHYLAGASVDDMPRAMMTEIERELDRVLAALATERQLAAEPPPGDHAATA